MIVGVHEELQVRSELVVGAVMVTLDGGVPRSHEGRLLRVRFMRSS